LRLFSFGGYGLALAALALMVFGAIECPPNRSDNNVLKDGVAIKRQISNPPTPLPT